MERYDDTGKMGMRPAGVGHNPLPGLAQWEESPRIWIATRLPQNT